MSHGLHGGCVEAMSDLCGEVWSEVWVVGEHVVRGRLHRDYVETMSELCGEVWRPWMSCEGGCGLHGGSVEAMSELCGKVWAVGEHVVRCGL